MFPRWQNKQNPIESITSPSSVNGDLPSRWEQKRGPRLAPGSTAKHQDDRKLEHKRGWLNLIKERLFVCGAGSSEHQQSTKKVGRGKTTLNVRGRSQPYTGRVLFYFCFCVVLFSKQKLKLHLFFIQIYYVTSKTGERCSVAFRSKSFVILKA